MSNDVFIKIPEDLYNDFIAQLDLWQSVSDPELVRVKNYVYNIIDNPQAQLLYNYNKVKYCPVCGSSFIGVSVCKICCVKLIGETND
jgi:hypothetical protein